MLRAQYILDQQQKHWLYFRFCVPGIMDKGSILQMIINIDGQREKEEDRKHTQVPRFRIILDKYMAAAAM